MSGKKRLFGILTIYLILTLFGWLISTTIVFFLENSLTEELSFSNLKPYIFEKRTLYLTGCIAILILIGIIYYAFKYKIFNFNNLINKVQRSKSNVHGNARWLEPYEMTDLFGIVKTSFRTKKTKIKQEEFFDTDNNGNQIKIGGGYIEREVKERVIKPQHRDYAFNELGQPGCEFEGYIVKSYMTKQHKLFVQNYPKDHALLVGTSGTGKSAYFISPTIQANARSYKKSSMVINDLKGELFESHSKLLKQMGYEVICINLKTPRKSIRYNPMGFIWDLYHSYLENNQGELIDKCNQQIIQMAETFCPMPEGGGGQNTEFYQGAQNILKGIIWAMLEDSEVEEFGWTKNKFTIMQIADIVNQDQSYFIDFLRKRHKGVESRVNRLVGAIVQSASDKSISSYLGTVKTSLGKYVDEGIEYLTSASDFDLQTLSNKPTAIFLIIPEEKERFVLATMIISQLYQYLVLMSDSNNGTLPRAWYFLLDEFGNMPKINNLTQIITLARSRNIWCCLVVQSLSMIKKVYGNEDAETIIDGCHTQILLGSNDLSTNEHFQKQFGTYTVYSRTASINDKTLDGDYNGSTTLTTKHLVELDELSSYANEAFRGTFYFKIAGQYPAKSSVVPFFSTFLHDNGTFVKGSIKDSIVEVKNYKTYYSLVDRYEIARWKYYDLLYREEEEEEAVNEGKPVPLDYPPRPACLDARFLNNSTDEDDDRDDNSDSSNNSNSSKPPKPTGSNGGGGTQLTNPPKEKDISTQNFNDIKEEEEIIAETTLENRNHQLEQIQEQSRIYAYQLLSSGIIDESLPNNVKEALKNNMHEEHVMEGD